VLTACALVTSAQLPGQDFLFFATTQGTPTMAPRPTTPPVSIPRYVLVNNRPVLATMTPFDAVASAPTPQYLECFSNCPATQEYNPICGSNRVLYFNENKFNCARFCCAGELRTPGIS